MLIGRTSEVAELQEVLSSNKAEFVAVYGRRRVGKTHLIEQTYAKEKSLFFHITGIQKGLMKEQLQEFAGSLGRSFFRGAKIVPPQTWLEAFKELHEAIEKEKPNQKIVIFMDEFPWLCTKKSRLLEALEYYWNHFWQKDVRVKLIICGSSASWIVRKIIQNKGGLHNRCTRQILLKPFSLSETKAFFKAAKMKMTDQQILEIYMFCGGVPFYLENIQKARSVPQQIDRLCFQKMGLLYDEFNKLFDSLFENAETYKAIIRLIASKREGISLTELTAHQDLITSGGSLTVKLKNLEDAAFIRGFISIQSKRKGRYYRVIDEYCQFFLQWIEPLKGHLTLDDEDSGYWASKINTPAYFNWRGYAFESICYQHIARIRKGLDIPPGSKIGTWRYAPRKKDEKGAQIDLVFDREDGMTHLCEIKCTDAPFVLDKNMFENFTRKKEVYKQVTRSNKQLLISLISANGIQENPYSEMIVDQSLSLKDLLD